jgi:ADP-ribose pyrophosphatase YjhB (NUDIX family)
MENSIKLSSGAIVLKNHSILLVRIRERAGQDFWVPPGGGAEKREGILACAVRETFEETGLQVRAERIIYVQEFIEHGRHVCKHWVLCEIVAGSLSAEYRVGDEKENLIEARFFDQNEIQSINVVPDVLKTTFWSDLDARFPVTRHLGFDVFSE